MSVDAPPRLRCSDQCFAGGWAQDRFTQTHHWPGDELVTTRPSNASSAEHRGSSQPLRASLMRYAVMQRRLEGGFRLQLHQKRSGSGSGGQPRQNDRDEPADRGPGRQAAGRSHGVQAVARELFGRDIIPEVAGCCALGQKVSDHVAELLLRSGDLLVSTQERR